MCTRSQCFRPSRARGLPWNFEVRQEISDSSAPSDHGIAAQPALILWSDVASPFGAAPRALSQPESVGSFETRPSSPPAFAEVYESCAKLVWRNLRRLGVPEAALEDAAQDVFLVVHRRLPEFEGRSSLRTWIFGIVLRVAAKHRRKARGLAVREAPIPNELSQALSAPAQDSPYERALQRQATELLQRVLETFDDERRALLIMVDLEQTSVAEAAEALEINLNTAYSRLRAARRAFEAELSRLLGKTGAA
jgi:RNA polymerase sigma-70 factor, ECF subfamily